MVETIYNKFKSKIAIYEKVAGIEVVERQEQLFYYVIILQQKKGEIHIIDKATELKSLEAVVAFLPNNMSIILTLNVKGVVTKIVNNPQGEPFNLQQIFPNTNPSNLYLQHLYYHGQSLISVIRKAKVEKFLDRLLHHKLWVVGFYVGNFTVVHLHTYLSEKISIQTNTAELVFNNTGDFIEENKIEDTLKEKISIGDDTIFNQLLVAYSGAFSFMTGMQKPIVADTIVLQKKEFEQFKIFRKTSVTLLLFFLITLCINTLLYFHFKSQKQTLKEQLSYAKSALFQADDLKETLEEKALFLQQTGINRNSKASLYADQIGQSIIQGIELTQMELFPLEGKLKNYEVEELKRYQKNKIKIWGFCANNLKYNEWLKQLRLLPWVETVEHISLSDDVLDRSKFEVEIRIDLQ